VPLLRLLPLPPLLPPLLLLVLVLVLVLVLPLLLLEAKAKQELASVMVASVARKR
jgi:hypothetical protein